MCVSIPIMILARCAMFAPTPPPRSHHRPKPLRLNYQQMKCGCSWQVSKPESAHDLRRTFDGASRLRHLTECVRRMSRLLPPVSLLPHANEFRREVEALRSSRLLNDGA